MNQVVMDRPRGEDHGETRISKHDLSKTPGSTYPNSAGDHAGQTG